MGGFRDFRVPVSVREIIAEPSFSYIRKVAVVCLGLEGQQAAAVVEIFDRDALADHTQSQEVSALFDGGLSSVMLVTLPPDVVDIKQAASLMPSLKGKALTVVVGDSISYVADDILNSCKIPVPNSTIVATFPEAEISEAVKVAGKENAFLCNDGAKQSLYYVGKVLSRAEIRHNQGMVYPLPVGVGTVTDDVKATAFYQQNLSFFFEDEEVGVKLGFSQAGGKSFAHRYIQEEVTLSVQQAINAYIDQYEPNNSDDTRIDLQIRSNGVLVEFGDAGKIDYNNSTVAVSESTTQQYESIVTINTVQAIPLWRVPLEIIQA